MARLMDHLSPTLRTLLEQLPEQPGCYLFKDAQGEVIYVGKAVNLRNRVRSYFHASAQQHPKTRRLVQRVADIEWIVVGSELEALILEMQLIKRYRPRYNVRLKDDKRYPYIKVHWADPFPKVTVTRHPQQDGARYYGPYTSVWAVHQTLDVLRRIFPYLTCNRTITGQDERACLYYDLKLCAGPCIGAVSQAEYRAMIDDLCRFLEGQTEPVVQRLETEMKAAAARLEFEKAARIRDQLRAIQHIVQKQRVVSQKYLDSDVLALARDDGDAVVQVFFIRGGKLIGHEHFVLENAEDVPDEEVLAEFLKQFYERSASLPRQVLLPQEVEEARIIAQWLQDTRRGQRVEIMLPQDEEQQALVQLAAQNAAETLRLLKARWEAEKHRQTEALAALQEALGLPAPPNRIEGYDISNLHGTAIVGSMVVFEQGVPARRLYRRFNIRSVQGAPDDYASLEEVLTRRLRRWQAGQEAAGMPGHKPDPAFDLLPDLMLVDGGPGQLARAVAVLERFGLHRRVAVVSLAKREEEVFVPGRSSPLPLPRDHAGLFLLQRVRDEAHRYALTSHRTRRRRESLASLLESIPGVGPQRRRALLQRFGSLDAIRRASVEELAQVPGISLALARRIKHALE